VSVALKVLGALFISPNTDYQKLPNFSLLLFDLSFHCKLDVSGVEISAYHSDKYEGDCLLGCSAM
jgi:hypothetical protein